MSKIYYNDKGVQLGNLLYLCLQVYKDRQKGEESYILKTGWYKQASLMFPNLATYFNKANGKPVIPFKTSYYQKHGEDFTSQELDDFCTQVLLPEIDNSMNYIAQKDVVICVRRGDMYAEHQKYNYGFDVIDYVNTALKDVAKQQTVRIVSDDIEWCHEHLHLEGFDSIEFCPTDRVDNFWQMVQTAKTLIIPNSTFAYWAAYLVRLLKPQVSIIAPNFNTYLIENGQQIADTRNWTLIDVTTELSKLKIGVFYVATGNYIQFFDEFYKTAKENLLTDCQVTYYVYTDNFSYFDKYSVNGDVVLSFVEHKPFPYPTLYRYHFFDKNKINWSKENYMLFFNANTVFADKVSVSVLPTSNQLKVWTLPVNQNLAYEALDFEKNPQSCAYVPKIDGQTYVYVQGGFLCATVSLFRNFINKMITLIETDQAQDITPKWHDESYLNKLINMNELSYSLLEQQLYLPEEYGISSKIVLLDKRRHGGASPFEIFYKILIFYSETIIYIYILLFFWCLFGIIYLVYFYLLCKENENEEKKKF